MSILLRRREFITLLGGAAAWPLAARAQQGDRVRRIGWLSSLDENDPLAKSLVSAFTQALADLGWTGAATWRSNDLCGGREVTRVPYRDFRKRLRERRDESLRLRRPPVRCFARPPI